MKYIVQTNFETVIQQELDARSPEEAIRMAIANLDSGCLCEKANEELIRNAVRLGTHVLMRD